MADKQPFGKNIPLLGPALTSMRFATVAFADEKKRSLKRQQRKSFTGALFSPGFASWWFKLLESPEYSTLAKYRPRLYFKPFRVYMSTKWNKRKRVKVILDTYKLILNRGEQLKKFVPEGKGIEIARFPLKDEAEGTLVLRYDERYRKEGELVLSFMIEKLGGMITEASFSFEEVKPGEFVGLIGCIQGNNRENSESSSKLAQNYMQGMRPKAFIIFAIQQFALHIGCTGVYGAGNGIQAFRKKHAIHIPWKHSIHFDYDGIYLESGGEKAEEGWFKLPLPPYRKSYEEIKTHKRALYRRRYAIEDDVAEQIRKFVQ